MLRLWLLRGRLLDLTNDVFSIRARLGKGKRQVFFRGAVLCHDFPGEGC
jgi:hypothetical protein